MAKTFLNPTFLYKFYDSDDAALYIGISMSVNNRLSQHKKAHWFNKVSTVVIKNYQTKKSAAIEEIRAIAKENPVYNRSGGSTKREIIRRSSNQIRGLLLEAVSSNPNSTLRELADIAGLSSPSHVDMHLNKMIIYGVLKRLDKWTIVEQPD